jgi:hypothetical protein
MLFHCAYTRVSVIGTSFVATPQSTLRQDYRICIAISEFLSVLLPFNFCAADVRQPPRVSARGNHKPRGCTPIMVMESVAERSFDRRTSEQVGTWYLHPTSLSRRRPPCFAKQLTPTSASFPSSNCRDATPCSLSFSCFRREGLTVSGLRPKQEAS